MAWPTPQDFREAVQNPRLAFLDAELQQGSPELDRLGLPRPWSGAFATVYRMRCAGRSWAVRCFLHPLSDEQERYAAISSTLASLQLPALVGCRFVADGIRVGPRRYPIVKMEWVEGESFNRFIERHLRQPSVLLDLAGRWMRMVEQLRQVSLAHGDLQHGNVLLAGGEFRLVDYDGMYVPALAGRASRELGHRNFQHPRRSAQDYGPWLDHFSSWVIYVSLLALAADASLWQRFRGGDECLLFRADDFRHPERSDLYRVLERSPDRRLRSAVTLFKSLLYLPPSQVPPLSGQILSSGAGGAGVPSPALGGWITDYVAPDTKKSGSRSPSGGVAGPPPGALPLTLHPWLAAPQGPGLGRTGAPSGWPAWMQDIAGQTAGRSSERIAFRASVAPDRVLLALGVLSGLLPWVIPAAMPPVWGAAMDLVLGAGLGMWLAARYRGEPARLQRRQLSREVAQAESGVKAVEAALRSCQQQRELVEQQEEADQEQFDSALRELRDRQRAEEDLIRTRLGEAMLELNLQRQQLRQEETGELQRLTAEAAQRMAGWRRAEAGTEPEELQQALRARQDEHRKAFLERQAIQEGCVSGLNGVQVRLLRSAGITSAVQLDEKVNTLTGLDGGCARRLLVWRSTLERQAGLGMPRALTAEEVSQMQRQREGRRRMLELQRQKERQRQQEEKDRLESRMLELRSQLEEQDSRLRQAAEQESRGMQGRLRQQGRELEAARQSRRRERELRLEELDREAEGLGRQTFGLYWRMDDLQQRLAACQSIRFGSYLLRVLGLARR